MTYLVTYNRDDPLCQASVGQWSEHLPFTSEVACLIFCENVLNVTRTLPKVVGFRRAFWFLRESLQGGLG